MSEQRKKPGFAFWTTVAVTLLAVYGGAYWALLDTQWSETVTVYLSGPAGEGRYIDIPADGARRVPLYRRVGAIGKAIFGPAHWVDKQLRPSYWAPLPTGTVRP